jgi:hypothetical protein
VQQPETFERNKKRLSNGNEMGGGSSGLHQGRQQSCICFLSLLASGAGPVHAVSRHLTPCKPHAISSALEISIQVTFWDLKILANFIKDLHSDKERRGKLSRESAGNQCFKILLQIAKGRVQNRVAGRCIAPPRIDPGGVDARNSTPLFPTRIH